MRWLQRIGFSVHERGRACKRVGRLNTGYQVIKRCRKRVEIAAGIGTEALNLLEGRIVGSVAKDACRSCYTRDFTCLPLREAEIQQNHLPARSRLQILWFDVAVDDRRFLGVQVVQRVEQLICPGHHFSSGKRSASLTELLRKVI